VGDASSDLGKARADLIAAEHDYARQKELFANRATPQMALEQSEDNYRKAKAEFERAQRKAYLFRAGGGVTQYYTLFADIDGEVVARNVNPGAEIQGQYSGGGNTNELFTIGQLDRVWVLADVYEVDLARVQVGAKTTVTVVGYKDKTFEGTLDWVSGMLDPTTRTAKIRCVIDNPEKLLKPEMYATVRITVAPTRALAVPPDAVVPLGDQTVVFVEQGTAPDGRMRYERVPVMVDARMGNGKFVPVLHGLDPGQKVVVAGAKELSHRL
jgi:cobalt-zinc-cadmium efflux system membrane fusion protein